MGDGRYYTILQFIHVIMYLITIIIASVFIIYNSFRIKKLTKLVLGLGVSLLSASMFLYAFEVVVNLRMRAIYYLYGKLLLLMFCMLYFVLLMKMKHMNFKHWILITLGSLNALLFVFDALAYSIYCTVIHVCMYVLLSNLLMDYKLSGSIFSLVRKNLVDYVCIINQHDEMIYQSDSFMKNEMFKHNGCVNEEHICDLFCKEAKLTQCFQMELIVVLDQQYLTYAFKNIETSKGIECRILTFVDVTTMVRLLTELQIENKKLMEMNATLLKQKDKVYELERKKEITTLIDSISHHQQETMKQLQQMIQAIDVGDVLFEEKMNEVIRLAKLELNDVRRKVSFYRTK